MYVDASRYISSKFLDTLIPHKPSCKNGGAVVVWCWCKERSWKVSVWTDLEPGSGGIKISEHQLLKIKEALSGKVLSDYIIDIDNSHIKIPKPLSP